jgi:large subunit ribosomal protein L5e
MGFIKVVKNKAYYKRYQVKFRRRREGKTDYYARKRLIYQDKNKYNSPKYRLVVRFTNKDIICQIVFAEVKGDRVMTCAYAHELPRYGVPVGLTNYAAAYCTGLLLARRHLTKIGLADQYVGEVDVNGEDYYVEEEGEKRPFCALLDVGLARTTTGARVFAAMKGACDGGLDIPHSPARFAGFKAEDETLDADKFRSRLFGGHVANYMDTLKDKDPEKYKSHFKKFIENGIEANGLEEMYSKAHAAIRADPSMQLKGEYKGKKERHSSHPKKQTLAQRKERIRALKEAMAAMDD